MRISNHGKRAFGFISVTVSGRSVALARIESAVVSRVTTGQAFWA